MTLSSDLERNDVMVHYVSVHIKIISPQPIVCDKSYLKCICIVTLTTDLEGQNHILFPMIDYVGVHVKINSLIGLPIAKYHYLSAFAP